MKLRQIACFFVFVIFMGACKYDSSKRNESIIPSFFSPQLDTLAHLRGYELLREKIGRKKVELKSDPIRAKQFFFEMLNDSIFDYWMNTGWDFNGHTDTPRKGNIACGYFITTTLRDMGVPLQRYKLAQQTASVIIEKLCEPTSIKRYTTLEKLDEYLIKGATEEIYILGLDYHVGFVVRKDGKSSFVHSDYIGRSGVKREKLHESLAIKASKSYVIGRLKIE